MTTAFIGLGRMGTPMALHLLEAGIPISVYDLDPARVTALVERGATGASSPAEAVTPGGVVFSMVPGDTDLMKIVTGDRGILASIGEGGVHVSSSTVSTTVTEYLTDLYARHQCSYVAANASGVVEMAQKALLTFYIAGPAPAKERIRPLLFHMGRQVKDLGDAPVKAVATKLAVNQAIPRFYHALADSAALAEAFGVPRDVFIQLVQENPLFACVVTQVYGSMIAKDSYEEGNPAFSTDDGIKDISLALEAGERKKVALEALRLYRDNLMLARETWGANQSWAAGTRVTFAAAGLPVRGRESEQVLSNAGEG